MLNAILILLLAAVAAAAGLAALRRFRMGGACCGGHDPAPKRIGPAGGGTRYPHAATLQIGGMTCESCARRVENALNALEGTRARVRIDTHAAEVRTANPPDEAALRDAVRRAGYVVTAFQPHP